MNTGPYTTEGKSRYDLERLDKYIGILFNRHWEHKVDTKVSKWEQGKIDKSLDAIEKLATDANKALTPKGFSGMGRVADLDFDIDWDGRERSKSLKILNKCAKRFIPHINDIKNIKE